VYREGDDATSFYVIMTGSVGTRMSPQLNRASHDEKQVTESEGYIAGVEYAGSSLGSDSFSSSLLPRHSSTRMAIERSELLVLDMSDYATIMRSHQREEEKQRMHVLKHIKAFELCTAEELWLIAQHLTPQRVTKNQIIFTQGEHADRLYFVSSGEFRAIYTQPAVSSSSMSLDLGRLRQYSFFGELGLWCGVRSATVYAETSGLLYGMGFDEVMKEWGDVLYAKEEGELDGMMRTEERWVKWKAKLMTTVRPQDALKKEANKSGKWEGRTHMQFK
jgi:CRP-like cAMP-binding protein